MNEQTSFSLKMGAGLLGLWAVLGTVGFMVIEGWNAIDSLYMTVITLSTVGFREVHEMSEGGRLFAAALIVVGLSTVLYSTTRIGQALLEGELAAVLGRRRMQTELDRLNDHLIVCGYGRIGRPVVAALREEGVSFCVIDQDEAALDNAEGKAPFPYVVGDATEEPVLERAGIRRSRAVLALLPSDAHNLYLTMSAKELCPNAMVIARGMDDRAVHKLKRGGASHVFSPYQSTAARVINAATKPAVTELLEVVSHRDDLHLSVEEVRIREDSSMVGRTLATSEIRPRTGAIVIAIKPADGEMIFNPEATQELRAGDALIALGSREALSRFEQHCG